VCVEKELIFFFLLHAKAEVRKSKKGEEEKEVEEKGRTS